MSEARDAILAARYMQPGETNEWDVWERVASTWSDSPAEKLEFYEMMAQRRALPNTPAIANAGKKVQCGSACFVLPIEDSLTRGESSIAGTLLDATAVHQFGGGTGFSFGRVRPQGSTVSTTGREAPGPVSFLRGYSDWFKRVSQAGLRPAANMGILPVDHPDIMDFITCKVQEGDISNFNISVGMTDEFMQMVEGGYSDKYESGYRTMDIWNAIIDGAWRNGEPGVFFTDQVNTRSLHPELIEATNPCGEVPLLPYEACVLGSVNLEAHVDNGVMDIRRLRATVTTLVRMLDNIIAKQDYPLPIIRETHRRYRKIGVGVMGYADALTVLGEDYGSNRAIALAMQWMKEIQDASYDASRDLADQRDAYPGYFDTPNLPYRRNLCCQVIAPTGTIARLAECSFGIEPQMGREYQSFVVGGVFNEVHPLKDYPHFKTYADVTPLDHIRTQAAFQKYTDQAVSKTVNLPNSATREDVDAIYRMAYALGCKGVTVLREGSREDVVIKPELADCAGGACAL